MDIELTNEHKRRVVDELCRLVIKQDRLAGVQLKGFLTGLLPLHQCADATGLVEQILEQANYLLELYGRTATTLRELKQILSTEESIERGAPPPTRDRPSGPVVVQKPRRLKRRDAPLEDSGAYMPYSLGGGGSVGIALLAAIAVLLVAVFFALQ